MSFRPTAFKIKADKLEFNGAYIDTTDNKTVLHVDGDVVLIISDKEYSILGLISRVEALELAFMEASLLGRVDPDKA